MPHSHSGPTPEQRASEIASAMASALGKFSDDEWRIGDWNMELTQVTRLFADALVAGTFQPQILEMLRTWVGDQRHTVAVARFPGGPIDHEVAPTWEYPKAVGS